MAKIGVGKQYGCWLVLSENKQAFDEYHEKQSYIHSIWNCECIHCHTQLIKNDVVLKECERKNIQKCKDCPPEDLTGKRIGRLTVRGPSPRKVWGKNLWICDCDCGNTVEHETGVLNQKNPPQSCGCLQREAASKVGKRTIQDLIDKNKPLSKDIKRIHTIWSNMKQRCENPNNRAYSYYGGRGISVCDEWHDVKIFEEWALQNGYEANLTIDRINTNGNYEPDNCRWITQKAQSNNTRKNKMITYKGKTQSLSDWCTELGLDYFRTKARLNACGYSIEEAFEQEKYYFQKNVQHKGNKANMITDV